MGHARGIKLLRDETSRGASSETQVALIALSLGMTVSISLSQLKYLKILSQDEAEKLLIGSKRHDLLNKMYQYSDQWSKALDVAAKHDRIHLRNTYYNFAKYCEEKNDLLGAIDQ